MMWIEFLKNNHWKAAHADDAYIRIMRFPLDLFFGIQFHLGKRSLRRGFTIYFFFLKVQISVESRLKGLDRFCKLNPQ